LVTQIFQITSAGNATEWAKRALVTKNRLGLADVKLVEDAFERRLAEFSASATTAVDNGAPPIAVMPSETPQSDAPSSAEASKVKSAEQESNPVRPGSGIDKSVLALPSPRRYRNKDHLRYVAKQACLVCGRKPSDPHHLRHMQPRALGRRTSDEFVVPLCRVHHREMHRAANERAWWKHYSIDPIKVARKLWDETRVNEARITTPKPANETKASKAAAELSTSESQAPRGLALA
jgi:hypothetical protein